MKKERNDFLEVKRLYGETKNPVVLDISANIIPDEYYGNDGEFCGVSATAEIIFPEKDHILMGGEINSGGLWGISVNDDAGIEEEIENQVEELKLMLNKLNVNYSGAIIKRRIL